MFCLSERPAGDARLRVDDDVGGVDQLRADERQERQKRSRRVAAGTRHKPRGGDLAAMVLRQAVCRARKKTRRGVLPAVPLGVDGRVLQPEIRRHVDDFDALGQRRDDVLRRSMRKPAKHGIATRPVRVLRLDEQGAATKPRCGNTSASVLPACVFAASTAMSMLGRQAASRMRSTPVYPLAPITPILIFRPAVAGMADAG